ncbi:MAG: hypothetical protein R3E01_32950 [Pirellulaceae bacterium]
MSVKDEIGVDFEADDVVIEVSPKKKQDGTFEWTYRFHRVYDFRGQQKEAYFFRREHDELVGRALVHAIHWMNENDATQWVRNQRARAA